MIRQLLKRVLSKRQVLGLALVSIFASCFSFTLLTWAETVSPVPSIWILKTPTLDRQVQVTLLPEDKSKNYHLMYRVNSKNQQAQSDKSISPSIAQLLFEKIQYQSKGPWSSDSKCLGRYEWKIRLGDKKAEFCRNSGITEKLQDFLDAAVSLFNP